jgi:hypothetical protein
MNNEKQIQTITCLHCVKGIHLKINECQQVCSRASVIEGQLVVTDYPQSDLERRLRSRTCAPASGSRSCLLSPLS